MKSYSQPCTEQDKWVVEKLDHLKGGYFVEAGAHDGLRHSNTKALEETYNWRGLLIEPNLELGNALRHNRPKCQITEVVLSDHKGFEDFVVGKGDSSVYSGIVGYMPPSWMETHKTKGSRTQSRLCVPLTTVLDDFKAPLVIDYLSLDVEGAELPILERFITDAKYSVLALTVEFRYDQHLLERLERLLEPTHVLDEVRAFDAFFLNREITGE